MSKSVGGFDEWWDRYCLENGIFGDWDIDNMRHAWDAGRKNRMEEEAVERAYFRALMLALDEGLGMEPFEPSKPVITDDSDIPF